jgi:hypothetical protein
MTYPSFNSGDVLTATDMNAVGLWKIGTYTATSGGSIDIDSVFTSTYDNYRIIISDVRLTSISGIAMKLRSGGTSSATSYYNIRQGFDYSTGVAGAATTANGSEWNLALIVDAGNSAGCAIDIFNPFLAQKTTYASQGGDSRTNGLGALSSSGLHNSASSYDGFTLFHGNTYSNIKVVVYGYRN